MFHALFWNDDMEKIRINKYISDAGFCSRREADQLIVDERVTINGVLAAMGAKVSLEDKVRIDGEILHFPKIISFLFAYFHKYVHLCAMNHSVT